MKSRPLATDSRTSTSRTQIGDNVVADYLERLFGGMSAVLFPAQEEKRIAKRAAYAAAHQTNAEIWHGATQVLTNQNSKG